MLVPAAASALPPLTGGRLLDTWRLDVPALCVAAVLVVGHAAALLALRRGGERWPVGRSLLHLAGVASLLLATTSVLAVYRPVLFWPAALGNTVLGIVTPILLALGDPLTLVRRAWPARLGPWVERRSRGRLVRVVVFPLLSTLLGAVVPLLLYFTGWFAASLRSALVRELTWGALLATGLLFVLPLVSEELLPRWCTWPVRAAIAFADGLLDALPGMLVALSGTVLAGRWYAAHPRSWGPTASWDQAIGGTLMLTATEAVGAPLLVAVFVAWSRADAREARALDAELDRADARRTSAVPAVPLTASPTASPAAPAEPGPDAAGGAEGPVLQRPWWETDPGPLRGRRRTP